MGELIRDGYAWFLDADGRLTPRNLAIFAALYGAFAMFIATAWRAALATPFPTAAAVLLAFGVLTFWLSPLGIWAYRAAHSRGVLQRRDLNAAPGVVLSWGAIVGLAFPVADTNPSQALIERVAVTLVAGPCIYVALRLLDRVALAHASAGLFTASLISFAAWRNMGRFVAWLHLAHLNGGFAAVRAERLPAWIIIVALASGAVVTIGLHIFSMRMVRRIRANRLKMPRFVAEIPAKMPPAVSEVDDLEAVPRAGFGADGKVREAEWNLERQRAAAQAERDVVKTLSVLLSRGWTIEASKWIRNVRIGDIDAFLTSPSGRAYAVDAKSHRAECTIAYDPLAQDLVANYPRGPRQAV